MCNIVVNSSLFVRNTVSTREEFVERVKRHYAGEVQQQMGKLLGHLSVLGAPLSFITGLGSSGSSSSDFLSENVVRVRCSFTFIALNLTFVSSSHSRNKHSARNTEPS
jgi:hypothetical protein